MAETSQVVNLPRSLPDEVTLDRSEIQNPRFTPRELRMVKEHTGGTLATLLSDDDSDEKFVVFGWLKLRRMGHNVTIADMDDVLLAFNFTEVTVVDPTNGQPPTTSQHSAGTGE